MNGGKIRFFVEMFCARLGRWSRWDLACVFLGSTAEFVVDAIGM